MKKKLAKAYIGLFGFGIVFTIFFICTNSVLASFGIATALAIFVWAIFVWAIIEADK